MTERKQFEAWWEKHAFNLAGLNIDAADIVWRGWQAARRWIPVSEFLPVPNQCIIFKTLDKSVFIGWYHADENLFEAKEVKTFATHWQPLPEPPKEPQCATEQ